MSKIILVLVFFLSLIPASACSFGCQGLGNYGIAGPINTIPAYTLDQGRFAINTSLRYQNIHELSNRTLSNLAADHEHAHSRSSEMLLNANMSYGITDDLNLIVNVPYRFVYGLNSGHHVHDEHDGHGAEVVGSGNSIGLGDLNLLAKYRILNHSYQAALIAGIKMPTGDTNEVNNEGERLSPEDQPGTGSWDPILGFAVSYPYRKFSFDANSLYRLSTQGSQGITVGDLVNFNTAATYNFQSHKAFGQDLQAAAVFEINGIWQESSEGGHEAGDSHGGLAVFLSPGLRLGLNKDTVMNFSVGLPVIVDLNGHQPDPGVQIFTGLSHVF